ncbi:MAG: hypothetical protein GC182_19300 [Rhodopseudomonas sp.]|nr:hypothetical protein [Rhodopseudomonas sp.]
MRVVAICAAALLLAGCANSDIPGKPGGDGSYSMFGGGDRSASRTVVLTNFILAAEVPVIDRGFSTRQESKGGNFPILERRARTAARVNDEINANVAVTLREAGYNALPGSPEAMRLGDNAVAVRGRLRPNDKEMPVSRMGFGTGRGNVVADMTMTASRGGPAVLTFSVGLPNNLKPPGGPARDAAVAAILATEDTSPEKLSPDVEAQARKLAAAIAEKIIAYARQQNWPKHAPDGAVEAKSEPKGESKVEAKADAKPEPKRESKADAKRKPAAKTGDKSKPAASPSDDSKADASKPDASKPESAETSHVETAPEAKGGTPAEKPAD